MELGEKLKQARQSAGLSQRQLCGDVVTRNMLSLIENGSAQPSMDTLRYFAQQLGKPISFFLEEGPACQTDLEQGLQALEQGDYQQALTLSDGKAGPVWSLLRGWARLELAKGVAEEQRLPYARKLLEDAREDCRNALLCSEELERRRLLLLYTLDPRQAASIAGELQDDELLLRADAALTQGDAARCAALLDSAVSKESQQWMALRGECYYAQGEFAQATACYRRLEQLPLRRLEQCYEKLGDYKMAYHYACLQREKKEG